MALCAAQADDGRLELEPEEVVATPLVDAERTDRYAGQATTVSSAQIDALNAQDLADALRTTPGVTITRYNVVGSFGGAQGGAVFIRGMGSSRPGGELVTLIDGVPVLNPLWSHPLLDLNPLDAAHAIEVIKGPQPWILGNAFSAVNLVTKRREKEGWETRLGGAYGRYDTGMMRAEHGGKVGALDYYFGHGYRSSQGHRDDADGRLRNWHARLGYQVHENWDVSAFVLHTDNTAMDPGPRGRPDLKEGRYETESWLATVTLSHRHGETAEGHLKAYSNWGSGDWLDQMGASDDTLNTWEMYGVRAREALRLWHGGEILAGCDVDVWNGSVRYTRDDGTTDRFPRTRFSLVSPYVAVSHMFGEKSDAYWMPSAGVRQYNHSRFDDAWSPHAGLVVGYGGTRTELHAGYVRGINYPGLNVVTFSRNVVPALGASWKSLDAERVDHFEVGVSQGIGERVEARVTLFHDDGENRYVVVPPPPTPPQFRNVGEFTTRGVEGSVTVKPLDALSLYTGFMFLHSDPRDLPYAPRWTWNGGMNWSIVERLVLSLDAQYVTEMTTGAQARREGATQTERVGSRFLLNGKLRWTVPWSGVETELFLAGENLTSTDYEYRTGYPMPGFGVMTGVQIRL